MLYFVVVLVFLPLDGYYNFPLRWVLHFSILFDCMTFWEGPRGRTLFKLLMVALVFLFFGNNCNQFFVCVVMRRFLVASRCCQLPRASFTLVLVNVLMSVLRDSC